MSADKPAPAEARAAFHFEVHGPGRDYDYSVFCEEHNNEATDCAAEWLAEAFDAAEVGEDISVKMRVVRGKIDIEEECVACAAESAAPPASEPALLPTLGRVMQERGHYESNDDNCGGCSECERIAKERDKASEPATACPSCGSDAPGDDRIDDGDGTHTIYSRVSLKRGGGDAELCPDAFHATRPPAPGVPDVERAYHGAASEPAPTTAAGTAEPPAPLGWRERFEGLCEAIREGSWENAKLIAGCLPSDPTVGTVPYSALPDDEVVG